jgi:hypothetical protein
MHGRDRSLEVMAEVWAGPPRVQEALERRPAVVSLGISVPSGSVTGTLQELQRRLPAAGAPVPAADPAGGGR